MKQTVTVRVAIVVGVQAVAIAILYGLAINEKLVPPSPANLWVPALAAFAADIAILWRAAFLLSKPVLRIAAVVSGAVFATYLGVVLAMLYSLNRWGG